MNIYFFKGIDSSIIQLSAKHLETGDTFDVYAFPETKVIPQKITNLTGIQIEAGTMLHNYVPVEAMRITRALEMFSSWLQAIETPILVAHNAQFDSRILINTYVKNSLEIPCIVGFSDSIKLFKEAFSQQTCYKQAALVKNLLGIEYEEHNSAADVQSLSELITIVQNYEDRLSVFTVADVMYRINRIKNEHMFYNTYNDLLTKKILTKSQAKNLSASGLSLPYLKLASVRSGIEGLTILLKGVIAKYVLTASALYGEFQIV